MKERIPLWWRVKQFILDTIHRSICAIKGHDWRNEHAFGRYWGRYRPSPTPTARFCMRCPARETLGE